MPFIRGAIVRTLPLFALFLAVLSIHAQSGNAGALRGTVTDPSGAVIPNVPVHLINQVSGLDRTAVTIHKYGNSSSASVPLALAEAVNEGRVNDGDLVLLSGFGAGMTWASAVWRWGR